MGVITVIYQNEMRQVKEGDELRLLLQRADMEIMRQHLPADSFIWISPAEDKTTTEFFFVLSGEVSVFAEREHRLTPGDSFYTEILTEDVRLVAHVDSELLCVTNRPIFNDMSHFQAEMRLLTEQIDQKDHRTLRHSRRVMNLCMRLYQLLDDRNGLTMDEVVVASMYHDVGMCNIPDEILKKTSRYTPEEYQIMKRHTDESAQILSQHYGDNVVRMVRAHHERMDGSGYPEGLKGDEIPLGSRILAVADSFEAMTSDRTYAAIKTNAEALRDLKSKSRQYDPRVIAALETLLASGQKLYITGE